MNITFDSYINNPMGGRTHMVGQRQAAAAMYNEKFDKMLMQSAGLVNYHLFRNPEDRYIIIIKIPSESTPQLFYDVAVEFHTKDDVNKKSNSLEGYWVRFFSNDPNFTYTYAYTFKKEKLIIPELEGKLDPKSMKEKPKVTNPNTLVGYVKSLYFAYLFITLRGLMNKLNWYGAPPINSGKMQNLVMATSSKLIQVDRLVKLNRATKKGSMHIGDPEDLQQLGAKVNQVKTTNTSKKIQNKIYREHMKRSPYVHRIGSVKRVKGK